MVSKGWAKKLLEETRQWVSEGIIDESQKNRICTRYAGRLEYRRLINTVVTLGSILVGLGILLFIASNWDKISRPAKITIILSVISAFNIAGNYFRYVRGEYPGLGEGFLLIGAFSFGAGIWLIAQIYQIHYNFSAGILFWIIGILPIVLVHSSWTILALSSVLSYIWLSSYQIYYFQRPGYGFFVLLAILVALCYRHRQRFSMLVMIAGLTSWLTHFWLLDHIPKDICSLVPNILMPHLLIVAIIAALGFILYGLGIWHQADRRFSAFSFLYKFLGVIFITLPSYSLTFAHHYYKSYSLVVPSRTAVLITILFILSALILIRLRRFPADDAAGAGIKEADLLSWFFVLQCLAMVLSLSWPRAASISYNLILVVQILGFMYLGFLRRSEGIFRLAIAIFFLDILSRYCDVFWKMMPRSLLFIIGGLIFIIGAIGANRKIREVEARMARGNSR